MTEQQQSSVNDESSQDVISREEFNKVYETLQKERNERKELEKTYKAQKKEWENEKAQYELKKDSEIDINERLEKALKIKLAPFEEKEQEYLSKISELETFKTQTKKEQINNLLKSKIVNVVNSANSQFKAEAIRDIEARAMLDLQYNEDVTDFVNSKGVNFDKWIIEEAKNSTWIKESKGAGLGGSAIKTGGDKAPQNYEEYLRNRGK